MSQLYGDLYSTLEPKRYVRGSTPDPLRLEAGLAFEQFLEDAIRERLTRESGRPDELTHHEPGIVTPILFNPDLIIFNHVTRLGEIKLTWLSCGEMPTAPANGFPPKFDKYVTQMACYCHCLETPYARLIGFFVNGGYEHQRKENKGKNLAPAPKLLAWDIEFSKREIREEWDTVIGNAKRKKLL